MEEGNNTYNDTINNNMIYKRDKMMSFFAPSVLDHIKMSV